MCLLPSHFLSFFSFFFFVNSATGSYFHHHSTSNYSFPLSSSFLGFSIHSSRQHFGSASPPVHSCNPSSHCTFTPSLCTSCSHSEKRAWSHWLVKAVEEAICHWGTLLEEEGNVILEPASRGANEGIQPKIGMVLDLLEHHPSIYKSNQV